MSVKFKMKPKIPKKFSTVLRWALDDVSECEKDKRFSIDMGSWAELFTPENDPEEPSDICVVCMAGAIMIRRSDAMRVFKRGNFHGAVPSEFGDDWGNLFHAINAAREGGWELTLNYLQKTGIRFFQYESLLSDLQDELSDGFIYHDTPTGKRRFKAAVRRAIKTFQRYERKRA